ncbi:NAD(P)/FAD-dependent oxidoreductase [Nucisporomicrobium flavum]|uniref:NAD(P)/FAD-dependent oxidoreductase n=1 Tax=Nucisporomicrobium flavum TaxID=2785915 RepID=UPI003C2F1523
MDRTTAWLATAGPDPFPAPAVLPAEVDAVVVGGGLAGVATAYWLARSGWAVLLAERGPLARGASGRNAGVFLPAPRPLEHPGLLRSVLAEEGIDAGFRRTGHLALSSSAAVLAEVRAEVGRRSPDAPPLRALDRPECEKKAGMPIAPRYAGGRWASDGHVVHPVRLVHGLAAAAHRRGACVATRTPVRDVVPGRRRGWRVHTARGPVEASHVVFACAAETGTFHPGLAEVITPMRGQVLATEALPPTGAPAMAVDFGSVYWRQTDDGAVVLGGCRSADPGAETGTRAEQLNPVIQRALSAFLAATFPGFPPHTVTHRWAGIMDQTADGRPLAGALPGGARQWVIAGFGGHGLPPALGTARALAVTMTTGRPDPLLAPLDPARFGGSR